MENYKTTTNMIENTPETNKAPYLHQITNDKLLYEQALNLRCWRHSQTVATVAARQSFNSYDIKVTRFSPVPSNR